VKFIRLDLLALAAAANSVPPGALRCMTRPAPLTTVSDEGSDLTSTILFYVAFCDERPPRFT
jgi:hypothetical protein